MVGVPARARPDAPEDPRAARARRRAAAQRRGQGAEAGAAPALRRRALDVSRALGLATPRARAQMPSSASSTIGRTMRGPSFARVKNRRTVIGPKIRSAARSRSVSGGISPRATRALERADQRLAPRAHDRREQLHELGVVGQLAGQARHHGAERRGAEHVAGSSAASARGRRRDRPYPIPRARAAGRTPRSRAAASRASAGRSSPCRRRRAARSPSTVSPE